MLAASRWKRPELQTGTGGGVFLFDSNLRHMRQTGLAWVAQVVERVLGKDEVTGSIPVPGSRGRLVLAGRAGVTQR